jgi:hypothetical protein
MTLTDVVLVNFILVFLQRPHALRIAFTVSAKHFLRHFWSALKGQHGWRWF